MPAKSPRQRRYAIITGAASGIGLELARQLAGPDWHLALVDRDEAGLQRALSDVNSRGGSAQCEMFDVADHNAWLALKTRLSTEWPTLDLLCNNAGVAGAGEVGKFPLDDWHWLLNINLFGPIQASHVLIDWLKQNPSGGHILNTASLAGLISIPGMGAYNVSKAGLVALSETMHAELRPFNIGVTVLCPGFVPTGLLSSARFENEQLRQEAQRFVDQGHITAAEVAAAALRAVRRKKLYVVVGWRARSAWRIKRLSPGLLSRLIAWFHSRGQK
jgi:short-subunit dehydrogenase